MNQRLSILLVATVVTILAGGCATQASPTLVGPPASPSGSLGVAPSGAPPTPVPSPPPSGEGTIDPATFLQLCDRWPDDAVGNPIECDRLVRTALRGLPAGEPVSRVETSYTCATSCKPLDPDRGYALVFSGDGAAEVEVVRTADGSYGVSGTTSFEPPEPPTFDAPPASAPAIDGAPASINARAPLPLCGIETRVPDGPFEVAARQCFWDGIRAGAPVEFIASHPDTEGLLVTSLYRYAGTGGVEVITVDEGGWYRRFTGVGRAPDGQVFESAGLRTEREPVVE